LTRIKFKARIGLPVKKELFIAIVVGFGLGLVVVLGIKTANQAVQQTGTQKIEPAITSTPSPFPAISLTIANPEDNALVSQEKISIRGETNPEAQIAIIFPDGEKILEAGSDGKFTAEITLTGGINPIEITALKGDNEVVKTINITYSTAEI
jgi:hypothetical protein